MAGFSLILVFFIFYGILILISLAVAVVQIIATWKLYEKAGEPGWTSIVPIYYYMQQIKIATGSFRLAWIYLGFTGVYLIFCIIAAILSVMGEESMAIVPLVLVVAYVICVLPICVIACYVNYIFAKAYGKSTLFCVLSIFFPQIMIIIMGFDKSTQYIGPQNVPQWLK